MTEITQMRASYVARLRRTPALLFWLFVALFGVALWLAALT